MPPLPDRDPAAFPGNPNPPAKTPTPAKVAAPLAGGAQTSAGTGALPPEAQDQSKAGVSTPLGSPAPQSYSVNPDSGIYAFTDKDVQRVGDVTLGKDDAKKILDASGAVYDEQRGTYDNVSEATVKLLQQGPKSFTSDLKDRFNAGLADFHKASLGMELVNGNITAEEFRERTQPSLAQLQIDRHPAAAWHGLGDAIHHFVAHPIDDGEDILKHSVAKTIQALPSIADIVGKATLGTVVGGTAAALTLGPAAIPAGAELGSAAGTFFSLYRQELGGRIAALADRGLEDADIKKHAPMEAVKSAVGAGIFMYGVDAMAAPFKGVFLKGLAGFEAAAKSFAKIASEYATNAGIKMPAMGVIHQMTSDLMDNLSAVVDKRPDLVKNSLNISDDAIKAAGDFMELGAVAGVPGAAIEGMTGQFRKTPGPEGGPKSYPWLKPETRESPEPVAGGAAPESRSPSPAAPGAPVTPEPASASSSSSPSESITPESVKVKAENEARPMLEKHAKEAGADPADPEFAKTLYQEHNARIHTAKEDMGITKDFKDMTKEEKVAFRQHLEEMPEEKKAEIENAFFESSPIVAALQRKVTIDATPEAAEAWAAREEAARVKAATPPPVEPPKETPPAGGGGEGEPPKEREFFASNEKGIEVKPLETDKATAKDIREQYVGERDEQIARVNQKMRAFRKAVPDEIDRKAAAWWVDAGGDKAQLAEALQNPKLKEYHAEIERALNLPENAQRWAETAQRYFNEAAEVGQERGTLNATRENYVNRLYLPEKEGDFVQGAGSASGVSRTTAHAKERQFDTMAEAAVAGKKFATTDLADLVTNYNGEIARANAARATFDSMAEAGLGAWKQEKNAPKGWEQVGTLRKETPIHDSKTGEPVIGEDNNQVVQRSAFYAPKGIADGLKAIAEPNFTRKIDALRGVQRYQGLVKTIDLSFSLFHHLSMVAQLAYAGDLSSFLQTGKMEEVLSSPDFAEREQEGVRHGLTTAITSDNADILRRLTRDEGDTFSKIVNLPGVKEVLKQTDKNADFLFGKVQRLWKVNTFSNLAAKWAEAHPEAENEEVTQALRGIAAHVNDRYGGQNWEAMGMTKSNLSLLRVGLLAPDWTISNLNLLKSAIGEGGVRGKLSRVHVLSSLMVGMAATEGLNVMLTGHTTDENEKGHELEVEIAPNVYVSLLRGGVQDITKLASMVAESGLAGVSRFAQGKMSPFARTGVGLLTNTQYTGRPIAKRGEGPVANTYEVLKFALSSAAPVPLGISNLLQYAQSEEPTVGGTAAVATGIGRFSQGKNQR